MKTKINLLLRATFLILLAAFIASCQPEKAKIKVIFDTDTNNELDDQHALAYLLFNGDFFDVQGVTVNATSSGGNITAQYEEAERIMKLCDRLGKIPLLHGADFSFQQISPSITSDDFDGSEAVNFIIEQAKASVNEKLVVIAVGKLTNVALALDKAPEISKNIRLVWLGGNYPDPGEYNLENDVEALNFVLSTDVPFEMVLVRYGFPTATDAVRVTQQEIAEHMPGMGPRLFEPVVGRHGESFDNFGDYSVNLFQFINKNGNQPSRALFDMAAVAIVKNPEWAHSTEIPAPLYHNKVWVDQKGNSRKITYWEHFNRDAIVGDFFSMMRNFRLAKPKK